MRDVQIYLKDKVMIPARIHAILAREADTAVVFRRGPAKKTAVIGWNLRTDVFKVGQWFCGSFYPYRGDLSPDGKHLIYFCAKYKRATKDETAGTASWTAVSRTPYLKALDLWFNGMASGWNGGGHFIDNKSVALNRVHHVSYPPRQGLGRFKEVAPTLSCVRDFHWGTRGGECPQAYLPRLVRDGWTLQNEDVTGWTLERSLRKGLSLWKHFRVGDGQGHAVYWEQHSVRDENDEIVVDGKGWEWADFDAPRKRIVYAEGGGMYALYIKGNQLETKQLADFNGMSFERLNAPY